MDLAKTQLFSLFTKAVTIALGITQSIIVIRILSPAEYGLVGLVMTIGGVIGVTQHLGIVDGAIREIAILKDKKEIGKVFWVSHLVRQIITLPLSIGLLVLASVIADSIYGRPEITVYLQLFAAVLVLQGLQDVLGATLTGLKKFRLLYLIQIVTAAINVLAFWWLTKQFGTTGFFLAIILTTAIMVLLLSAAIIRLLPHNLALPSRQDLKHHAAHVLRVGTYMYLARILFVVWHRLPILILGGLLTAEELGYLTIAQTFGSKLTIVGMALSEVNLSWMSSLFVQNRDEFSRVVTKNIHRLLILLMCLTVTMLFFTPEILRYIIGSVYLPAQPIILIMTLALFLYSLMDVSTSSTFVPADQPRFRALIYALMTVTSAILIGGVFIAQPNAYYSAWAVLIGVIVAYGATVILAKKLLGVTLLPWSLARLILTTLVILFWLLASPVFIWRLLVFVLMIFYVAYESVKNGLIPKLPTLGHLNRPVVSTAKTLSPSPGSRLPRTNLPIICFAGAQFDLPFWTNRQQITSRLADQHDVLYIEPRIWIFRFIASNLTKPKKILLFFRKSLWYEKIKSHNSSRYLYVKAQWNLIPGSREYDFIAKLNHFLNRWNILLVAKILQFIPATRGSSSPPTLVMLIYDTEAAEYLVDFPDSFVLYDCVDDHAAQAGADRNPERVRTEEKAILTRANLVTVTSRRLLDIKKKNHANVHLVSQAGDTSLFHHPATSPWPFDFSKQSPIIGSVGSLDAYKYDFALLHTIAQARPNWQFVFIGKPIIDQTSPERDNLQRLPNVHMLGQIDRHRVPGFVSHFDVCIIPYHANKYNQASFPLKFWEFMASGKPIVASGLPELRQYDQVIHYAQSPAEFVAAIDQALLAPDLNSSRRVAMSQEHSWENRVVQLESLLHQTVDPNHS